MAVLTELAVVNEEGEAVCTSGVAASSGVGDEAPFNAESKYGKFVWVRKWDVKRGAGRTASGRVMTVPEFIAVGDEFEDSDFDLEFPSVEQDTDLPFNDFTCSNVAPEPLRDVL